MTDTIFKTLYQETYGFLLNNTDKGFMEKQLISPKNSKAKSLKGVYQCLLDALIFTRRMKEIIDPVESLDQSLFNFNPRKIHSHYGDHWEKLYEDLAKGTKQQMHWETFCKGAISGASFLTQIGSIKKYKEFIHRFQNNEMSTAVLPLLLQRVIHGLNFPMACTFLYNTGSPEYIFPDPKVKALLMDIGVTESMENYGALKTLILMARINQKPTEHIHKIFWLIGNGALSKDGNKDQRYRKQFVEHIIPILNCLNYQPQQHQL
jgi:hypothetical protein